MSSPERELWSVPQGYRLCFCLFTCSFCPSSFCPSFSKLFLGTVSGLALHWGNGLVPGHKYIWTYTHPTKGCKCPDLELLIWSWKISRSLLDEAEEQKVCAHIRPCEDTCRESHSICTPPLLSGSQASPHTRCPCGESLQKYSRYTEGGACFELVTHV